MEMTEQEGKMIQADVSYRALVHSVIWMGHDALTKEYELEDRVSVDIPAGSHPHFALVQIADSICRKNHLEIKGHAVSPVPDADVRARMPDGRIQVGTPENMLRGYMTLKLSFSENAGWLTALAETTMATPSPLSAEKYHTIMLMKYR